MKECEDIVVLCFDFHFVWHFPEFHPGVPWKGLQNIDPENDPDVTPGSVPTGPTINTTIQDVNRYLLKSGGEERGRHPLGPEGLPACIWGRRGGARAVGQGRCETRLGALLTTWR